MAAFNQPGMRRPAATGGGGGVGYGQSNSQAPTGYESYQRYTPGPSAQRAAQAYYGSAAWNQRREDLGYAPAGPAKTAPQGTTPQWAVVPPMDTTPTSGSAAFRSQPASQAVSAARAVQPATGTPYNPSAPASARPAYAGYAPLSWDEFQSQKAERAATGRKQAQDRADAVTLYDMNGVLMKQAGGAHNYQKEIQRRVDSDQRLISLKAEIQRWKNAPQDTADQRIAKSKNLPKAENEMQEWLEYAKKVKESDYRAELARNYGIDVDDPGVAAVLHSDSGYASQAAAYAGEYDNLGSKYNVGGPARQSQQRPPVVGNTPSGSPAYGAYQRVPQAAPAQPVQPALLGTPYNPSGFPSGVNTAFTDGWNQIMGGFQPDARTSFTPAYSYGGEGGGNLASAPPQFRPPPFEASASVQGGAPMPLDQFASQQSALIQRLNEERGRQAAQSGVYAAAEIPQFYQPSRDFAAMWGQAGNMVQGGWTNPLAGLFG